MRTARRPASRSSVERVGFVGVCIGVLLVGWKDRGGGNEQGPRVARALSGGVRWIASGPWGPGSWGRLPRSTPSLAACAQVRLQRMQAAHLDEAGGAEREGHANQYLGDATDASSALFLRPVARARQCAFPSRRGRRRVAFMPRLSSVAAAPAPASAADTASRPKGEPQPAERFALAVDKSPIDGLGVFAAESIPARRKIGEMRGEIVPVREARRRIEGRRRIHVVEVTDKHRHRCDEVRLRAAPRESQLRAECRCCASGKDAPKFYAIRDIDPGEEICADYGESHHEGRLRCRCGAPNCKGRL